MLARLKFIDFRREQDFDQGLDILIGVLRGRPPQRGGTLRVEDIYFREDAALLKQHRRVFDRAAFQTPCIMELFKRRRLDRRAC
jgi:hypothetical protein